jgi:Tfp pilus assembly protein PilO
MNLDDLKNIDLKNIDVKELVQKLKDSEYLKDKKFLTKFGIYFGSILLFLIIYYAFVNPKVKFQKERINIMLENEKQITVLGENIIKLNNRIKEIQPEYDKKSKLFHSQKEVEGLYQNISNFASSNNLNIINLNKEDAVPISGALAGASNQGQNNDNNQNTGNNQNQNVAYFKIPVSFEITGNYLGYLKFRRALAQSNKVINFDMEKISIVKGAGINSVGTISIVGLPDEYKK